LKAGLHVDLDVELGTFGQGVSGEVLLPGLSAALAIGNVRGDKTGPQ